jgi:hypothetical protein
MNTKPLATGVPLVIVPPQAYPLLCQENGIIATFMQTLSMMYCTFTPRK